MKNVLPPLVIILERYISALSVRSTLARSLERCGLHAGELPSKDAAHVVAEAMVALRLFCPPNKLPELMLELADFCEACDSHA